MLRNILALFKKKEPSFDETFGNPKVQEFVQLLKSGDYQGLERLYRNLDWAERSLIMRSIVLEEDYSKAFKKWHEKTETALSTLVWGTHHVFMAWQARSSKRASEVTDQQFVGFLTLLEQADTILNRSIALNPRDPEPYAQLIRVHMGLSSELELLESYFAQAIQLCPDHLSAHMHMVAAYNPKWLGSLELMYDFAEKAAAKNSPLLLLPLQYAITEHHLYYDMNEMPEAYEAYYTLPETKAMVQDSFKKYKEPQSGKALVPLLRSYFAYNLYRIGAHQLAKEVLVKNNYYGTQLPWAYYGVNSSKELEALLSII
ncbi:MAG TPA: hypothetical protein VL947_09165 [Cytophagales bacterium]|nr:hypothetical protein [Cytophagales bacterium]